MFSLKNITTHAASTLIGLLIALVLLALPACKVCAFGDVAPALLIILPFLLYGRNGSAGGTAAAVGAVLVGACLFGGDGALPTSDSNSPASSPAAVADQTAYRRRLARTSSKN